MNDEPVAEALPFLQPRSSDRFIWVAPTASSRPGKSKAVLWTVSPGTAHPRLHAKQCLTLRASLAGLSLLGRLLDLAALDMAGLGQQSVSAFGDGLQVAKVSATRGIERDRRHWNGIEADGPLGAISECHDHKDCVISLREPVLGSRLLLFFRATLL